MSFTYGMSVSGWIIHKTEVVLVWGGSRDFTWRCRDGEFTLNDRINLRRLRLLWNPTYNTDQSQFRVIFNSLCRFQGKKILQHLLPSPNNGAVAGFSSVRTTVPTASGGYGIWKNMENIWQLNYKFNFELLYYLEIILQTIFTNRM